MSLQVHNESTHNIILNSVEKHYNLVWIKLQVER